MNITLAVASAIIFVTLLYAGMVHLLTTLGVVFIIACVLYTISHMFRRSHNPKTKKC